MPIIALHQENFSVLTDFVNESTTFSKVSTFSSNTLMQVELVKLEVKLHWT